MPLIVGSQHASQRSMKAPKTNLFFVTHTGVTHRSVSGVDTVLLRLFVLVANQHTKCTGLGG
mgnify:CR=1